MHRSVANRAWHLVVVGPTWPCMTGVTAHDLATLQLPLLVHPSDVGSLVVLEDLAECGGGLMPLRLGYSGAWVSVDLRISHWDAAGLATLDLTSRALPRYEPVRTRLSSSYLSALSIIT